jgi:hypothetical protein
MLLHTSLTLHNKFSCRGNGSHQIPSWYLNPYWVLQPSMKKKYQSLPLNSQQETWLKVATKELMTSYCTSLHHHIWHQEAWQTDLMYSRLIRAIFSDEDMLWACLEIWKETMRTILHFVQSTAYNKNTADARDLIHTSNFPSVTLEERHKLSTRREEVRGGRVGSTQEGKSGISIKIERNASSSRPLGNKKIDDQGTWMLT